MFVTVSRLLLNSCLWLAALPIVPIVLLFLSWLYVDGQIWEHLIDYQLTLLLTETVVLSLGVVFLSALLGGVSAFAVQFFNFPGRRFLSWALLLPFALPTYVQTFIWIDFLDYSGWLASLTRNSFDFGLWLPMRSIPGGIWCLSLCLYPYVYLMTRGALMSQGQRAFEVSQSLGVGFYRTIWKVFLPRSGAWMASALLLVLMEVLADYGAVALLGIDTLSVGIYKLWYGHFSPETAAQLASLVCLFIFLVVFVEMFLRQRKTAHKMRGEAGVIRPMELRGVAKWVVTGFCWGLLGLGFIIPMLRLFFMAGRNSFAFWVDANLMSTFNNSLLLGALAGLCTVSIAFLSWSSYRLYAGKWREFGFSMGYLGYAFPGAVLAVGVYLPMAWLDRWLVSEMNIHIFLTGGMLALLTGYSIRFLAIPLLNLKSAGEKLPPKLDEAALSLKSTGWSVSWFIHRPLVAQGLIISFLLVMVDVMKEMPMTLMMRPLGWDTLAVRIYQLTSEGLWYEASIPALFLVGAGLIPVFFLIKTLESQKI